MSMNAILTEPNEKKKRIDESNYKRVKYLIKENTQLKEQVKDLSSLLELNRDALQCMATIPNMKGKEQRYSDGARTAQETYSTVISRDRHEEATAADLSGKSNIGLVNLLVQENKKLADQLHRVIEERNTAQNRSYLSERIIQQNMEFEDEIVKEYREKIEGLKMNIRTKEYILHEFECLRLVPSDQNSLDSKTYFIFKEVVAPYKLVNSISNEKKLIENELVEERIANSKIRKDFKTLFDKATVLCDNLVPRSGAQKIEVSSGG